jgi:tetratricopeptide (TPR) repeat protein
MMEVVELARGTVADRPWALTLATVARRGVTGQVTLVADQKHHAISFHRGAIVAARSPMIADSVARVALTNHLIAASQVAELQRRISANPKADEIDLVGELANLSEAQLATLRVDVITRRAARTFAPEQGEFVVEDTLCLPAHASTVDIRAVVYHGIRMHVSDARLTRELRALGGTRFLLATDAASELPRFGFCDGEWPIFEALREGASIPELEARHRDIDPRTMLAAIYALVACGTAHVIAPPRTQTTVARTATPDSLEAPALPRAPTLEPPALPRAPTLEAPALPRAPTPPRASVAPRPPVLPRTPARPAPRASATDAPAFAGLARGTRNSIPPPEQTKSNPELAAEAVERASRALASDKPEAAVLELKKALELVPNHVDYNALLGWALFCAADDMVSVATEARKLLEKGVYKSQQPEVAQFYLGRVERILGRDKEALRHFQAVLDVLPNHRDASAEVRVIEARMKRLGRS